MFSKKCIALIVAGAGAACLLITQTAASKTDQGSFQLGGAWVGSIPGLSWSAVHSPIDPNGKRAVANIQWYLTSDIFDQLLGVFGADSFSEGVGEHRMIDHDTAQYTLLQFLLDAKSAPIQVKASVLLSGEWTFVDEDTVVSYETLAVYSPAKTYPNGLPKPGVEPDFVMPSGPTSHHRVPILPPVSTE